MMEIRLKLMFLENLFLCLCLLTGLGQEESSVVVTVREGSEAVLPCFIRPEKNIERYLFDWRKDRQKDVNKEVFMYDAGLHSNNGLPGQDEQFRGRISHFPDKLQFGDASIRINNTRVSDSGNYTCDFPRLQPKGQIFFIKLVVVCIIKDRWEENIRGASLKPDLMSHDQSKDLKQLRCKVQGVSPKPKVEWQDSSGNILPAEEVKVTERGGSYDIILKTTVTETDDYRCVVTQEEICHQISAVASVYIHDSDTGWIVDGVVPAVLLIVLLRLSWLLCKYYKKFCSIIRDRSEENIGGEDSELIVMTFKTKDGMLLRCVVRGVSPKPEVELKDSSGKILRTEEPQVIEREGKYDIILNATVTKTDRYHCVVTQKGINHQVSEEISVKIPVFTDPEPPEGGASELFVRIFKTDDEARLRCVVRGVSPKSKVKWQDSSGKILPAEEPQVRKRGGSYFIILQTTVTKTGNYLCVIKQKGIEDQTHAQIFVFIPDSQTETKGNQEELVELNRNHDTSAV